MKDAKRHIHIVSMMVKGNIGTLTAEMTVFKLLKYFGYSVTVSIPSYERATFMKTHNSVSNSEVCTPLIPTPFKLSYNDSHLSIVRWVIFTLLNLLISTIVVVNPVSSLVIKKKFERDCRDPQVLMSIDLEMIHGIPITLSPQLIASKPRIIVIHMLFWLFRTLQHLWWLILVKSLFKRKKLVIGPASFGPFQGLPRLVVMFIKFVLNRFVDLVLVREPYSYVMLRNLDVKNAVLVTDAALLEKLDNNIINQRHYCRKNEKLIIAVAPASFTHRLTEKEEINYVEAHAKCLDSLASMYGASILFLPSAPEDIPMCKRIISRMKYRDKAKIFIAESADKYEANIRMVNLLITTRMHPSIIATRNLIPSIIIVYDHKQLGLLRQLNLLNLSILINNISEDILIRKVNYVIKNLNSIKDFIESNLPKVRQEMLTKFCKYMMLITHSK